MNPNIFINPSKEDLIIPGELLSIDVKFTSFIVKYQLISTAVTPGQMEVQESIYPIKHLQEFFKVNGALKEPMFNIRPSMFKWAH